MLVKGDCESEVLFIPWITQFILCSTIHFLPLMKEYHWRLKDFLWCLVDFLWSQRVFLWSLLFFIWSLVFFLWSQMDFLSRTKHLFLV